MACFCDGATKMGIAWFQIKYLIIHISKLTKGENNMGRFTTMLVTLFVMTTAAFAQTDPNAKLNLVLEQPETNIQVGETFEIPLMVSAATTPQRYVVADIVFGWNTEHLEFVGISHEGSHPLIWRQNPTGLPYCPPGQTHGCGDFYGINELPIPADGNGLYYGYNVIGSNFVVTEPVQIVKFIFKALAPVSATEIQLLPEHTVYYTALTVIYGSSVPGMVVTGTTTNAVVTIVPTNIAGDFNGDGTVDSEDMSQLLTNWGLNSFKANPYDLDGDGTVGSGDLAILLDNWS